MAFQYKRRETVPASSRRIVRKEIDKCLKSLRAKTASDETIHEVRKRFQKVRAILKLVRGAIGDKVYERENTCFRDAAAVRATGHAAQAGLIAVCYPVRYFGWLP